MAAKEAIEEKELEAAKEEIESGITLIQKQQKLIRIADREENGWEVVKHYLSDDLADNSDDEKAIKKARKEALATINKRKGKKREQFRNAPPYYRATKFTRDSVDRKKNTRPSYERTYDNKSYYDRKKADICFRCGKEGHFMYVCPRKYDSR